ncbi:MAG: DEAD/DEAH box helicase [Gemmataceae bacterium]
MVLLMRRDLSGLRLTFGRWLQDASNTDEGVAERLQADDNFTVDDVIATALTRVFHRAIATFEVALLTGSEQYFRAAMEQLASGESGAAEANHVPLWWAFKVARHLGDGLWGNSLRRVLPGDGGPTLWPIMRERFIQMLAAREVAEIDLWPSQVQAARRVIDVTDDLVVALPTSAGKTRIAELCILRTLADERRVIYVTPLRALSAQIEHGLARTFRPLGITVTSVYGASGVAHSDLTTLKSAKIVVATPEKLDFAIRQEPSVIDDVGLIVLDEGHMIGLSEREIRYEMLVQRLLRRADASIRRLVCLSAVFSEGDAFEDFAAWLRSDAPGTAVRSTWRPTRQRPGNLRWMGSVGRLEFDVESETPFVPRFVESKPALGKRKQSFPQNDQEFIVVTAASFLNRGQTVLLYCPQKSSVEPTAEAFLKAHKQGYFLQAINAEQQQLLCDAIRIGEEWLGASHPAVACLALGIAVHHGSLPRQFLGEIETLLRKRILPVCICSPTLAQGLDLCFSVLLFRSLHRAGSPIPAKEFANVVGRVGRAFVDLDGLYVLPIFDTNQVSVRLAAFRRLISQAQRRQLESGVRELLRIIITVLQSRLNCTADELAQYVLNLQIPWQVEKKEGDMWNQWLEVALNELDTAILGIVDTLDMPTEKVADYLDSCLQSSYWQRRLQRETPQVRSLQEAVIRGRAQWIWTSTTADKRRALFAASIGFKAGTAIEERLQELGDLLRSAEEAIGTGSLEDAIQSTVKLAEILFTVGPFLPDDPIENWRDVLGHWLRGTALGSCTGNDGVSFIQDNVVYRLVWAVEAARLHLEHLGTADGDPPGGTLALCLTYGVPNLASALFMQAGMRSRPQAVRAVEKAGTAFATMRELRGWVRQLRRKEIEPVAWETDVEQAEWDHFLARFDHRYVTVWRDIEAVLPVEWAAEEPPKENTRVRVNRIPGSERAIVSDVSALPLGETTIPREIRSDFFFGLVRGDTTSIAVSFFGL